MLSDRVAALELSYELDLELDELRFDLMVVRSASSECRQSTQLRELCKLVLAVGNTLNGSTFRGNAKGISLDSLLKVSDRQSSVLRARTDAYASTARRGSSEWYSIDADFAALSRESRSEPLRRSLRCTRRATASRARLSV